MLFSPSAGESDPPAEAVLVCQNRYCTTGYIERAPLTTLLGKTAACELCLGRDIELIPEKGETILAIQLIC